MKKIVYGCLLAACVGALSSCSKELDTTTPKSDRPLTLSVGSYPAFDDPQTRAVGTFDAGKTAWEEGDVIFVTVSSQMENEQDDRVQRSTLTYNATTGSWTSSPQLYFDSDSYSVQAIYAPNYEWNNGQMQLKADALPGSCEYLVSTTTDIEFLATDRKYSRLRIATTPNASVKITMPTFIPSGNNSNPWGENTLTFSADANGNVLLYGSWPANTSATVVDNNDVVLYTKSNIAANVDTKGYVIPAFFSYKSAGTGTEQDPYQIYNAAQLQNLDMATATDTKIFEGQYIKLMNDIDGSAITSFNPIGDASRIFSGTFDGNGHTIKGLKLGEEDNSSGLFFSLGASTVKNLTLLNPTCSAKYQAGAIAAQTASPGTIILSNCHVRTDPDFTGKIKAGAAGGLIGINNKLNLDLILAKCSSSISVEGVTSAGGLVGNAYNISMLGCFVSGKVAASMGVSGASGNAGGLIGYISQTGKIIACYTTGAVSGDYAGGLISNNSLQTTLLGCYTTGAITGTKSGSLAGWGGSYLKILYCASTTNTGTLGVGYGSIDSNSGNITLNCGADLLLDAITTGQDGNANNEWYKTDYNAMKTACGLDDTYTIGSLWKLSTPPTLWWE